MAIAVAGTYAGPGANGSGSQAVGDVVVPAHTAAIVCFTWYFDDDTLGISNTTLPVLSGVTMTHLGTVLGRNPGGSSIISTAAFWCTGAVVGSSKTLQWFNEASFSLGVGITIAFLSGSLTTGAIVSAGASYEDQGVTGVQSVTGLSFAAGDWTMACYGNHTSNANPDQTNGAVNTDVVAKQTVDSLYGGIVRKAGASSISISNFNYGGMVGWVVKVGAAPSNTNMVASAGTFVESGKAAAFAISMAAAKGTFIETGIAAVLSASNTTALVASTGSFALIGKAAQLIPGFYGDVTFTWTAGSGTPAGYRLEYGTSLGSHPTHIDVGNVLTYTVSGLGSGRYYWVVVSYDGGGDSGASNEQVVDLIGGSASMVASVGTFLKTGQAAAFNLNMHAFPGTFVMAGKDASLSPTGVPILVCNTGHFTLTGNAIGQSYSMQADMGVFRLQGGSVETGAGLAGVSVGPLKLAKMTATTPATHVGHKRKHYEPPAIPITSNAVKFTKVTKPPITPPSAQIKRR